MSGVSHRVHDCTAWSVNPWRRAESLSFGRTKRSYFHSASEHRSFLLCTHGNFKAAFRCSSGIDHVKAGELPTVLMKCTVDVNMSLTRSRSLWPQSWYVATSSVMPAARWAILNGWKKIMCEVFKNTEGCTSKNKTRTVKQDGPQNGSNLMLCGDGRKISLVFAVSPCHRVILSVSGLDTGHPQQMLTCGCFPCLLWHVT